MKLVYGFFCFIGAAVPLYQFFYWVYENGISIPLMIEEISGSRLSLFAWLDVVISAIVLLIFIAVELRKVRHAWLAIAGTLSIGVSFGLPLYLLLRELSNKRVLP